MYVLKYLRIKKLLNNGNQLSNLIIVTPQKTI